MKIDIRKPEVDSRWTTPAFTPATQTTAPSWQQELAPNMWVHLLELPSAFSFDEALLLCQYSDNEWVAWIPDCGETILNTRQFCQLS